MNQLLIHTQELHSDQTVVLADRRAIHLRDVLRVNRGDTVRIGLLGGGRGYGEVLDVSPETVALACRLELPPLPPTGISVLLALPRPKVLRRLFAPLAASGVENIFLTNAEKVERVYFDTHWLQPAQYEPLLQEGLEQSGETRLPRVRVVKRLKPLIEDELLGWSGSKFILHPATDAQPAVAVRLQSPLVVAVGPEGGWTDYEVALFRAHGFTCISLGERILRSDAAVHTIVGIFNGLMFKERKNGSSKI